MNRRRVSADTGPAAMPWQMAVRAGRRLLRGA